MTAAAASRNPEPPPTEHWAPTTNYSPLPNVRLLDDGQFQIHGVNLDQHISLHRAEFVDVIVYKAPGEGQILALQVGNRRCRLKYEHGRWYAPVAAPPPPQLPPPVGAGINGKIPFGPFRIPDLRPFVQRYRWAIVAAAVILVGVWTARLLPKGAPNRELKEQLASQSEANRLQKQLLDEQNRKQELDTTQRQRDAEREMEEHRQAEERAAADVKARQDAAARSQEAALAHARLSAIRNRGQELLKRHAALLNEIQTWDRLVAGLPSNDLGRKLAGNSDNVRLFVVERDKVRPSADAVKPWEQEIHLILKPIEDALASDAPAHRPSGDVDARLNGYFEKIDNLIKEFAASRRLLEGLAAASKPGSQTLQAAIDELARLDAQARAAVVARETAAIRQQADQVEAERQKRAIADNIEQKRRQDAADRQARQAQQAHDRRLAESQSSDVEATLKYFFTPGYIQPKGESWEKETELRPYSLSRLRAAGALEPTKTGLKVLLFFVTTRHEEVRPKWGVISVIDRLSASEMERLKKAQKYLNEYGDVLVERKKLAP